MTLSCELWQDTLLIIHILVCVLQEISFDVFLQVVWADKRIKPPGDLGPKHYIDLTMDQRNTIWVPDLYIRQLREMKILKVFEEISSLRIYENSTISLSIGATIIIKCDMDFVLYPLDVQSCPVDFSSCKSHCNESVINDWTLLPPQISTQSTRWHFIGGKIIRSRFPTTSVKMGSGFQSMSSHFTHMKNRIK